MKYAVLLVLVACSPGTSAGFECAAIQTTVARARASAPKIADGTFQPFTTPPMPAEAHTLTLGGNTVHVPVAPYRCTPRWNTLEKHMSVTLVEPTSKTLIILGPMDGAAPMDDVFALVGDGPAPPDRVAATKRLFGKSPNLFDLEAVAWNVNASKLTCTPDTVEAAARDSIALILKTVAAPATALTAHQDVGFAPSHLLVSTDPDRHLFEYRWRSARGEYWSMSGVGTSAFVEAGTALVATFGGSASPRAVPLPGLCEDVLALANAPSKERALALRARAEEKNEAKLMESLDFFLRAP